VLLSVCKTRGYPLSLKGGSSLLALLVLTTCTAPKHGVDAVIPLACVKSDIRMIDCDASLTDCKHLKFVHAKGCEILEVKR
jgi:hypothetical protein